MGKKNSLKLIPYYAILKEEYYLFLAKSSPDNFTPVHRFIALDPLSKRNPPDPPP